VAAASQRIASLAGVIVPSPVIGWTLLYASRRDAAAPPEFRDWLRTFVGRTAPRRYATT